MRHLILLTLLIFAAPLGWGSDSKTALASEIIEISKLVDIYDYNNEIQVVALQELWTESGVNPYWVEIAENSLLTNLAAIDFSGEIALALSQELSVKELEQVRKFFNSKTGLEITRWRTGEVTASEIAERFARIAAMDQFKYKRGFYIRKIFRELDWVSSGMRQYLMSGYLLHYLQALTNEVEPLTFPEYKIEFDKEAASHGMAAAWYMLGVIAVEHFETPEKNLKAYSKFLSKKPAKKFYDVINRFEVKRFQQALNTTFIDLERAVPNI